jgi:hypothetical protein
LVHIIGFRYDQLFDHVHADVLELIQEIRIDRSWGADEVLDLTVSLDGTWKERGHQSMYGILFLIESESDYCADFET